MATPATTPPATTSGVGSLLSVAGVDPWSYYDRVRGLGDVVWDDEMDAWLVTAYEPARQIGLDAESWRHPFEPDDDDPDAPILGMPRSTFLDFHGGGGTKVINT